MNRKDVQFIVDEKGNPSAVVIDIDLYAELVQQLEDLKMAEFAEDLLEGKKVKSSKKKK